MAKKRIPVLFIHGLWLHASSWEHWLDFYRDAGYEPTAPTWPGDSKTVAESRKHPEFIANRGIQEITEHYARVISRLGTRPIVIGHSFGGLIAQKLLGQNLAIAAIAIDPVQAKGVRNSPLARLRNSLPVLADITQVTGANSLSKKQFHKVFANVVSQEESDLLHEKYTIPAPGRPLFQTALANLVPSSAARVNTLAKRGPLLITGGEKDLTVPEATSRSMHALYKDAKTVNDYTVFKNRGHSLVIDAGWKEVADYTLEWLKRQSL